MKVVVEDKTRIKKVNFLFPSLMNNESEMEIKEKYRAIQVLDDYLHLKRDEVRELENELKSKKDEFAKLQTLFTLEFEDKEVEYVDVEKTNLSVINPNDPSN